ncbi:Sugar-specific transcriptional regulator TrmB [Acholeplasma oculi]|uniref:Putative transcriptional regulator, TmrB-like protein n=1 Tax=Acholeplasma oculi TaxID=35623 RepID=A0A061AAN5_9MOLU|nr:TrmB family transcriptional regulator [Acholeplasma oculi]CDR30903.1 putative transcriptional regulator, TmrB-like protein [Acholeplasma oculi]SKC35495.1 Sugar-specific transcriptional regulator TrmB [Acholeplasma oculi]SUT90102.1 Sugar-specific transcriptional regulator TrmB [Acholeplasma oculi]
MNKLIDLLKSTYFSENESIIYMYLLENPGQTVYEISKNIRLSRSSTYPIVDKMHQEGMLLLESGKKELYYAQDPKELLNTLDFKHNENMIKLKKEFEKVKIQPLKTPYFNLNGFDSILGKARTLLYESRDEVYMSTDLPLELFEDAFDFLNRKGVDVYIFTFSKTNYSKPNVFIFSHQISEPSSNRLMLVSDLNSVLVANFDPFRNEWQATATQNHLMISIVSEHIHHDIYLIKLKNAMNVSLFETYPELAIHTKAEQIGRKLLKTDDE